MRETCLRQKGEESSTTTYCRQQRRFQRFAPGRKGGATERRQIRTESSPKFDYQIFVYGVGEAEGAKSTLCAVYCVRPRRRPTNPKKGGICRKSLLLCLRSPCPGRRGQNGTLLQRADISEDHRDKHLFSPRCNYI